MDRYSEEKRSQVMSTVRSKGTKLEELFKNELDNRGISGYQLNRNDIVGRPDIVFENSRIAIFLDSCFWHGCPKHLRMPASKQEYWIAKIARNKKRDRKVNRQLRSDGWVVVRIWEHSIKNKRALKWRLTRIKTLVSKK